MRILVTGACGFIGHHVVESLMEHGHEVVMLDRIDGTSTLRRIWDMFCENIPRFVWHDLRSPINDLVASYIGQIDVIMHLAASTHVDRSIQDGMSFIMDNVVGTANLLEYARKLDLKAFFNFSTDEVLGPAPGGHAYKEWDRHDPKNPYSATKAAAVDLASAFANTYKIPVTTTYCMNVFGQRQHPEKFVPLVIRSVLRGDTIKIHTDKNGVPGSRFYIHASTVAKVMSGLVSFLRMDMPSGQFMVPQYGFPVMAAMEIPRLNIPGVIEIDNLSMAKRVSDLVGKKLKYELVDFHSDRPGHDLRYGLNGENFESIFGPHSHSEFEKLLAETVRWYLANQDWLLL